MIQDYKTEFYKNNTKLLLFFIVLILVLIGLFVYIGKIYKSDLLGLWLPILIIILPIAFSKKLKKDFKKNVILGFSDTNFQITFYSLEWNEIMFQDIFLWQDIKAYRFYFSSKLTTSLTLYLNDNKNRTYIFLDNKTYEESIKQDSVFSNFLKFVKRYNQNLPIENQIHPRGGFIVTKIAGAIILGEATFILIVFFVHLIKHSLSNSYYLVIAIGFLIPQIINRIQNKNMYNKINKLE